MKSSLSTTDVQICVKYIENFSSIWQRSFRLSCFGLKGLHLSCGEELTHRTSGDETTSMMFLLSSWLNGLYKWQAPSMGWQPPAAKGTSLTWRKLISPLDNPWFRYFGFIRYCIFCHLMVQKIIRCGHGFSSYVSSGVKLKNQTPHGWDFTFSIATTEAVVLGDNNSTEESSQFFWHRKSYPHVALRCRRQWENISKSLSNIYFCRVPKSVSSCAVCSQLSWRKKKKTLEKKVRQILSEVSKNSTICDCYTWQNFQRKMYSLFLFSW